MNDIGGDKGGIRREFYKEEVKLGFSTYGVPAVYTGYCDAPFAIYVTVSAHEFAWVDLACG